MFKFIGNLCTKYKEFILYGIFGAGSTLINIIAFYLFDTVLEMNMIVSNVLAWILAFIFSFVTNKIFVFESKSWKGKLAFKQFIDFFITRIATLFVDTFLMWLFIDVMTINNLISKLVVNIIIIILNYIASKFWIFKKGE